MCGATPASMPHEQRIHALTYDELEALRRLQEGSPAPGPDDLAWSYLLSLGLVWLDTATLPATLGHECGSRLRDGLPVTTRFA
jgi:hypothetical protein